MTHSVPPRSRPLSQVHDPVTPPRTQVAERGRPTNLVSVIIPTYNERAALPVLLTRLGALRGTVELEVVVVDDASPDGTGALADEMAREGPLPILVVHRPGKSGLASAVLDGAAVAHGGLLTVMDSDLSHPPEQLPALLRAMDDGADIAIASRYVPGGGVEHWPLYRRVISRVATALARVVLGLRVYDPLSGFFATRRELLVGQPYAAKGYKLLTEVLARHPASRVVEIPYRFVDRQVGTSKLSSGEIVAFARLLWRLRRRR